MSIKSRFWLLVVAFVSALTVAAIINMISSSKQQVVMAEIADALTASQAVGNISRLMESNQSQILYALQYDSANPTLAASHYFPVELYYDQVKINVGQINESWEIYLKTHTAQMVKEETELFQLVRGEYLNTGLLAIIDLMKANQFNDAYTHFQQQTEPLLMNARPMADMIATKVAERVATLQAEAKTLSNLMTWILQGVVIAAILFGIGLAIYSIRIIASNLDAGREWASRILTTGQLSHRLGLKHNDEISVMLMDIQSAFSSLDEGMKQARQVVSAIARADFSQRMKGVYVGDLQVLQEGVNGSAESVDLMMRELGKVMEGLNAGRFDVHMDTKVPQAFRALVETALDRIHGVVTEINTVMMRMNDGDFNARVEVETSGHLLTMKDAINDSMARLSLAVTGINSIVRAQADGDLTQECTADFKGQLNDLKVSINATARKLRETVSQVALVSSIVNEEAGQVSQGASDLSGRVQEQAAALEQTSSTMDQMATEVNANTANARKVADLAIMVKTQSIEGAEVMQQTIGAMQSIRESSSKIADIVTLIDGIAFQTNLLALNAAVEAARAGDHGRGFAVVAGEVRALAGKSANAAKDIKTLIMDSVQRIEAGTSLADKSGEMLTGISKSVQEVAGMIDEIANASHEQSVGIGQVRLAIAQIDDVTQQNAALVEETTAAAEHLSDQANSLREDMSFFNTGTEHAVERQKGRVGSPKAKSAEAPKAAKALPAPADTGAAANEWSEF